jgi:aspartate racemase
VLSSEGTVRAALFEAAAAPYGMQVLYPTPARRADLQDFIYRRLKNGQSGKGEGALLSAGLELADRGAEALLLGCTELSLPAAAPAHPLPLPVIDPLVLLAHRTLSLCGKKIKEAYRYDAAWRPALEVIPRAFAFAPVGGDHGTFL